MFDHNSEQHLASPLQSFQSQTVKKKLRKWVTEVPKVKVMNLYKN